MGNILKPCSDLDGLLHFCHKRGFVLEREHTSHCSRPQLLLITAIFILEEHLESVGDSRVPVEMEHKFLAESLLKSLFQSEADSEETSSTAVMYPYMILGIDQVADFLVFILCGAAIILSM